MASPRAQQSDADMTLDRQISQTHPIDQYSNQHHFFIKSEPDSAFPFDNSQLLTQTHYQAFPYNGTGITEQELAESLGWDPSQFSGPVLENQDVPVLHETTISASNRNMLGRNNISHDPYGSVPIPQNSVSPVWSTIESPNFYTDGQHLNRGMPSSAPLLTPPVSRKDGHTAAEKKAMRRYSHNACNFLKTFASLLD